MAAVESLENVTPCSSMLIIFAEITLPDRMWMIDALVDDLGTGSGLALTVPPKNWVIKPGPLFFTVFVAVNVAVGLR